MAWDREYAVIVPGVSAAEVWAVWSDVNNWNRWDTDIEYARLDGPFATGQEFTLKPKGGPCVRILFEKVQPFESYTDRTIFPLACMWGVHDMRETERGLELRCRIRIVGPLSFLWRKLVAEGVAGGLEQQTRQMIAYIHAQRRHVPPQGEHAITRA